MPDVSFRRKTHQGSNRWRCMLYPHISLFVVVAFCFWISCAINDRCGDMLPKELPRWVLGNKTETQRSQTGDNEQVMCLSPEEELVPCEFASVPERTREVQDDEIRFYQIKGVRHFLSEFERVTCQKNWLQGKRVLDNGCDTSGKAGVVFQQKSGSHYIGVNCAFNENFPHTLQAGNQNTQFLATDCGALPFADQSFHAVISDNILEHASNLELYFAETYRVLKPGGIAMFKHFPFWDSPRGHHIHDDMVLTWAKSAGCSPGTIHYKNDGSVIPDFSHLKWSPQKMKEHLLTQHFQECPKLVDKIIKHMFLSNGLNRIKRADIEAAALKSPFVWAEYVVMDKGQQNMILFRAVE